MATSPPHNPSSGDPSDASSLAAAALEAPARVWRSLVARLPPLPDSSSFLAVVSDLQRRYIGIRRPRRRRLSALPLPLRPAAAHSARIAGEMPKAFVILDDVVQHTLTNLHSIHKSLLFWQAKAEKVYFMIFERGPRAFVDATYQTLTRLGSNGRPVQYILHSASDMVSTKLAALTSMQHCLAAFLAEIHSEVDKCREGLTENSDKSLHTLFIVLNTTFSKLEVSLRNAGEGQDELFTHDGSSYELFGKLPEVDVESSEWTEALATDGTSLVYQNLQKLDSFLSSQLSSHKRPDRLTMYWLPYTCGAVGLSVCSLWLLRHSSLMGSPDIDNWVRDAKESVGGFWDEHVEKPIISIRDELFETFKQRDKGVMENQEVQLTEDSLRRMLVAFCEQTEGRKLPEDLSVQAMLETLTKRYEKELIHPIQNLFSGELARAMLIQIQKLKLDLESGLLEMDQILRANAINLAVLAALPAFGLSLLLLVLLRTWIQRDHGAEGRGNIARCQRRLLLVDVERRLMEFQHYRDNGMEEEARCKFGLVLYTLDRLCKAVESHAKETGEWLSLREDIFDLAKLDMGTPDKMIVVSRLKWMYNCLLPFSSSRLPRL
ncbi:protein DGS1, mitochondrial-like isoform X2 [Miscanthus floridulus]|uniref:protein DGS1, mitochondrial-like isoform X2 n=1 Tax=Miscanthus floridulus TaxID=154761 RepID=UPI0034573D82